MRFICLHFITVKGSILKYVVYAFTCHVLVCLECVVGGTEWKCLGAFKHVSI